jgi:hypothetical protein
MTIRPLNRDSLFPLQIQNTHLAITPAIDIFASFPLSVTAKVSSVCRAFQYLRNEQFESAEMRRELKVPVGTTTVDYLKTFGVPSMRQFIRRSIQMGRYFRGTRNAQLNLPRNPPCRLQVLGNSPNAQPYIGVLTEKLILSTVPGCPFSFVYRSPDGETHLPVGFIPSIEEEFQITFSEIDMDHIEELLNLSEHLITKVLVTLFEKAIENPDEFLDPFIHFFLSTLTNDNPPEFRAQLAILTDAEAHPNDQIAAIAEMYNRIFKTANRNELCIAGKTDARISTVTKCNELQYGLMRVLGNFEISDAKTSEIQNLLNLLNKIVAENKDNFSKFKGAIYYINYLIEEELKNYPLPL